MTNEALLAADVSVRRLEPLVLRRTDFSLLFDTSPDLSGHDLDIAPYVRDVDQLSVQVGWAEWDGAEPPVDLVHPDADWCCRAPIGEVRAMKQERWRRDATLRRWTRVAASSPVRPGERVLVRGADGGYRVDTGFDPSCRRPVSVRKAEPGPGETFDAEDSPVAEPRSFGSSWVPLDVHLGETADEAEALCADLDLPDGERRDVVLAARVHDVGKAHPDWQDALCATAEPDERTTVADGRPWAKSGHAGRRLSFGDRRSVSHELAGLLLLDGPLAPLVAGADDADLVRYLVLSHHGRVRTQIRARAGTDADTGVLGLVDGAVAHVPTVLGQQAGELRVTLERARLSADGSDVRPWADVVAGLLDRYGMFRLAYLESLVRVADWRASARHGGSAER